MSRTQIRRNVYGLKGKASNVYVGEGEGSVTVVDTAVFACGHGAPFADHDPTASMRFFNELRQES